MDRKAELEWLRDTLRDSIAEVEPDKRAPLANQFRAVLAELDELAGGFVDAENVSPIEEARRRREARLKA